ncbi:MAG: VWA domain-containing protein [Lentisphaerae bacterium]|nr:VWA domain-containing protein [Lentisphaerota bacterium]
MNTENQKCCCRYLIFILFWTVIIALGFMLIPEGGGGSGSAGNGTGQYGSGTGSGDHGSGSGKGQGDLGSDKGAGSSGNNAKAAAAAKKTGSSIARSNSRQGKNEPKDVNASGSGKLPVASKDKSNDNIATINLAGKDSGNASGSGTSTGFFGVEASGSVIFLLDVSGSMASSTSDSGMSRLELVKKEVEKTLADRHAQTRKTSDRFRIVCFSSGCSLVPDQNARGYRFSSMEDVAKAIDFVKALSPGGGTEMMRAWQAIIPIIKAEGIQSVYFLSDGEPQDCNSASLTAFLKQEVPKLTIHSISMGQHSELLKNVSQQHHGQYKDIR